MTLQQRERPVAVQRSSHEPVDSVRSQSRVDFHLLTANTSLSEE